MQILDNRSAEDLLIWLCIAGNAVFTFPCRIMLLTLCADTFLVLLDTLYLPGVLLFCVVQVFYALQLYRREKELYGRINWMTLWLRVLLFILPAGLVVQRLVSSGAGSLYDMALSVPAVFSFSQLLVNTLCAIRNIRHPAAPYRSGRDIIDVSLQIHADRLFAVSMLLFLGCDLCVGLRNLPVSAVVQNAAYALNWIFYIPSQVLLSLSLVYFREEQHTGAQTE